MKIYKFKVIETWMGGKKDPRFIELKARTEQSAVRKLMQLCGNRLWEFELVIGESK